MNLRFLVGRTASTCLMLLLAACGGGGGSSTPATPGTYTIGGAVSGLAAGQQVTLNNNADPLTLTGNGPFTFANPVALNGSYAVTVGTQPTGQTCSVSSGSGAGVNANVSSVAVACSTNTFTIGGAVSGLAAGQQVTLNNNNIDPLTLTGDGPFTFANPVAFNGSYDVTVGTQPTGQTCDVSSASGGAVTANVVGVAINCRARFAYVVNYGDGVSTGNTVSQYTVGGNGALTPLGSPVATGIGPRTVAVDPMGRYAYVANGGDGTISQYTIGSNGVLTPMTPASVPTGSSSASAPWSVVVDPSGQYAYVTNSASGDNTVSQYTIGANGALTPMTPARVPTGTRPFVLTVDPTGRYAYVANFWDTTVSQYTIGAGGALTPMSPATVTIGVIGGQFGERPLAVTVDPAGQYAYVTLYGVKQVLQYTIAAGGALTGNGTPAVSTGNDPWPVTIDPTGQYAYWSNTWDDQVSQNTIGAGGGLTPMSAPLLDVTPHPTNPKTILVDSTGRFAYVVNSGVNSVYQYTIGSGGALAPMGTASVPTGTTPYSITMTR